jgi:hypothetical protein
MLNVIYRRFGIDEFSDSLQRFDQEVANRSSQAPILRVFRRIADYNNQLQPGDMQEVSFPVDLITVPALYCDRNGIPADYASLLEESANFGEEELTHVLLALIWIQENGCELPVVDDFIKEVYLENAALIGDDPVVDDIELEAAVFLCLAGQVERVQNAFIERVIAAQREDGGWSYSSDKSGDSNWHPSVLALLLLLHIEYPAESYPPMLAPASP